MIYSNLHHLNRLSVNSFGIKVDKLVWLVWKELKIWPYWFYCTVMPLHICWCLRHWDYSSYPVMLAPLYFLGTDWGHLYCWCVSAVSPVWCSISELSGISLFQVVIFNNTYSLMCEFSKYRLYMYKYVLVIMTWVPPVNIFGLDFSLRKKKMLYCIAGFNHRLKAIKSKSMSITKKK